MFQQPDRDPLATKATWKDRLSADAACNPVIADLIAQCRRCGAVIIVEIGGTSTRWVIRTRDVVRDERGDWRHARCRGKLRFHGRLPDYRPRRIVIEGEEDGAGLSGS